MVSVHPKIGMYIGHIGWLFSAISQVYIPDLVLGGGGLLGVNETLDYLETRHSDCCSDCWTGVVLRPPE